MDGSHWGQTVSGLLLCVTAGIVLRAVAKMESLRAAAAPIEQTPTAPLTQVTQDAQVVELQVRVKQDAKTHMTPGSLIEAAWWECTIKRVYRSGRSTKRQHLVTTRPSVLVPIQDASGEGLLDMGDAAIELSSRRTVISSTSFGDHPARGLIPKGVEYPLLGRFEIVERLIFPGEALYILGRVLRMHQTDRPAGYRDLEKAPIIGTKGEPRMVVCSGTEEAQLAKIRAERAFLAFMLPPLLGSMVLIAVLIVLFSIR